MNKPNTFFILCALCAPLLWAACSDEDSSTNNTDTDTANNNTATDTTSPTDSNTTNNTNNTNTNINTADTSQTPSDLTNPPNETACRAENDGLTTIVFINRCTQPLNVRGSDIENATVPPDASVCRNAGTATEILSAKRYWAFLDEDPGPERHTLAEFTFNTDFNDFDWYNISHVDAHNLTMQIVPLDRPNCDALTCADTALLTNCPAVGRYENAAGELLSCVSPERDNPQSEVALHFESCDGGYAWSGDDQQGDDPSPVKACAGEDWAIIFCP